MKRIIIDSVVFIVAFIASAFILNQTISLGAGEATCEMAESTLPIVTMENQDMKMNVLHGYKDPIDASVLRESVTPLEEDKTVRFDISRSNFNIQSIQYELRTPDNTSLIENGKVEHVDKEKDGTVNCSTVIRMELKENLDYVFKLIVHPKNGVDMTYYTRLVYRDAFNTKPMVEFAKEFTQDTFDKGKAQNIVKYLEPDPNKVNNNLGEVDITSDFESITWLGLAPKQETRLVPTISELSKDVASMEFDYVISAKNASKQKEYYTVKETFRIRYTSERMYLLSYKRTVDAMFDKDLTDTKNNSLKMGISENKNIHYVTNDTNRKVAFVKNHQLWYYDYQHVQITRVFSFLTNNVSDAQSNYGDHDIRIIRMDKSGNIIFAVYGYMNRGKHEGQNGVSICEFNAKKNSVEEKAFVSTNTPYASLSKDCEKLVYLNKSNELYMMFGNKVICLDTKTKDVNTVVKDADLNSVAVSNDGQTMVVQSKADISKNKELIMVNLETGKKQTIQSEADQRLRVVGFVGNDLVYGIVNKNDIKKDSKKGKVYPMKELYIIDQYKNLVKKYKTNKSKRYIINATVANNMVQLGLADLQGGSFENNDSDYIMNKEEEKVTPVSLEYTYTQSRFNELYMIMPNYIYLTAVPDLLNAKEQEVDEYRTVTLKNTEEQNGGIHYFVYNGGNMNSSYTNISKAVETADEKMGMVVDSRHKYIWEKSGIQEYGILKNDVPMVQAEDKKESKAACVAMILQYEGKSVAFSELQNLNADADVIIGKYIKGGGLDLTGCSLDQVMYYICQNRGVIAKKADGRYVLLSSFNSTKLKYTDPVENEIIRENFAKMREEFKSAGNVFYSYVK